MSEKLSHIWNFSFRLSFLGECLQVIKNGFDIKVVSQQTTLLLWVPQSEISSVDTFFFFLVDVQLNQTSSIFFMFLSASSDHLSSLDKRHLFTMYLTVRVFPQLETVCNDPIFRGYGDLDQFSTYFPEILRKERAFRIQRSNFKMATKPQTLSRLATYTSHPHLPSSSLFCFHSKLPFHARKAPTVNPRYHLSDCEDHTPGETV